MTALLSLTNSSSNRSDITQLPFRPQRECPHFSREHNSMSTESFQNCSCECCNDGDEGRRGLLKICPLFYVLTARKSRPRHGSESLQPRIWTYTCPQWRCPPPQFQRQWEEKDVGFLLLSAQLEFN